MRITLAHDFGKNRDYAADVIAAKPDEGPGRVIHLERYPLGYSYRAQAAALCGRLVTLRQQVPQAKLALVVDGTGVGQAAQEFIVNPLEYCDLFLSITFSGGNQVKRGRNRHELSVPKTLLIDTARRALATGWLVLPPATASPAAAQLLREFATYEAKATARGGYTAGARREKDHDDLVSAFLLSAFALTLDWARL